MFARNTISTLMSHLNFYADINTNSNNNRATGNPSLEVKNMAMDIANKARGALMLDQIPANAKHIAGKLISHGPLVAAVEGSGRVWNTMTRRVDGIAGTKLSQGGPLS